MLREDIETEYETSAILVVNEFKDVFITKFLLYHRTER